MAQDFTIEFHQAKLAAQKAGEEWLAAHTQPAYVVEQNGRQVGTMLDVCGRCYVETKMNTAFGKWIRRTFGNHGGVDKWLHFRNDLDYRQEMGLHEAMAAAALASLKADGITGLTLYSWID
jgi:hypothetical protein